MAKKKVAGVDDAQVFKLKCPTCREPLEVVNFRIGPLDKMRGVHRVDKYGWIARCPACDRKWGDFLNPMEAPSMWTLIDLVDES